MPTSLESAASGRPGIYLYPNGNNALAVVEAAPGILLTCFSNAPQRDAKVLVTFDPLGIGSVCYASGKPWLVVTQDGWLVSDPKGNVVERGTHPRTNPTPVVCAVSKDVSVEFKDRGNIHVTYTTEGEAPLVFDCGEKRRRTESHLGKVVGSTRGKLELDVGKIRQRQRDVGSVYVPRGPQSYTTEHPGLGGLKAKLAALPAGSALAATVKDLQSSDARLRLIEMLPKPLYGTSRTLSTASPAATQALPPIGTTTSLSGAPHEPGGVDGGTGGLSTSGRRRGTASSPLLPDFGSPPLSKTQRRLMRKPQEVGFSGRRTKLPRISLPEVETTVLGKGAVRDTLYCLCLLADWNPVCLRLEPQLQQGAFLIQQDAASNPAGPGPRIRVLHVDASEGTSLLQARFKFRTVPMCLMFFEGKLVCLTNNINTADELRDACVAALEKGRRGDVLPDHFSIAGMGNSMLDYITPDMSLRA